MKIQRVTFLGVRGLADTTLDFSNPTGNGAPHAIVVLTGGPASGKTRALEAIVAAKEAIAPYGPMSHGAPWIAAGSDVSKVQLAFWLDEEERTYAGTSSAVIEAEATFHPQRARGEAEEGLVAVLERYAHDPAKGKVEYFPANRRITPFAPFGGLGTAEQRILRPTSDPRKYSFAVRLLQELGRDPARAEAFASRLAELSATLRYAASGPAEGMPRCLSSHKKPPVSPLEISDGEADAVIFAATAVAIGLGRSLVLIDRPELHADPRQLPRWVAGLRALGDDNQLVLASSSPALAAAAEPALVVAVGGRLNRWARTT